MINLLKKSNNCLTYEQIFVWINFKYQYEKCQQLFKVIQVNGKLIFDKYQILMAKQLSIFLSYSQEFNLPEEEDERIQINCPIFPSKFIKQLNFRQNCQKHRQRRIKKMNQFIEIKSFILDNVKKIQEKQKTHKADSSPSSENMREFLYKGNVIKGNLKKKYLNGDTQIFYENGAQFKGIYKNGKMRTGTFDFKNGYQYWGQLQGKNFLGKGTLKCPNGTRITGIWNKDYIVGRAQIEYVSGDIYYGEVQNFKKHGEGYFFFKSGNKYIGHFQNGQINGFGTYFETNGTVQKGIWKNGELIERKEESFSQSRSEYDSFEPQPEKNPNYITGASEFDTDQLQVMMERQKQEVYDSFDQS